MPGVLPTVADCTEDCDPVTTLVPGAAGAAGAAGTNGTDGVNAFTTLASGFTMPAIGASETVTVVEGSWITVGQFVAVAVAGNMEVVGRSGNTLTLENTGASGNAVATTVIASGGQVSPAGNPGADGTDGDDADVNAIGTTLGDLLAHNGSEFVRKAVGSDGLPLIANSSDPTGVAYQALDLADPLAVTGPLPVNKGGTGTTSAVAARASLGAAARGANSDITSLTAAFTTPLTVSQGGTGVDTEAEIRSQIDVDRCPQDYLLYRHEETSGTDGGDFTSGSWQTVDLNTEVDDTGAQGAVAANQVTLVAGTYRYRFGVVGFQVGRFQGRLYNVTDAGVVSGSYSAVVKSGAGDDSQVIALGQGRFTIADTKAITLQAQCETTNSGDGFGKAASFGGGEVYSWLELEREIGA